MLKSLFKQIFKFTLLITFVIGCKKVEVNVNENRVIKTKPNFQISIPNNHLKGGATYIFDYSSYEPTFKEAQIYIVDSALDATLLETVTNATGSFSWTPPAATDADDYFFQVKYTDHFDRQYTSEFSIIIDSTLPSPPSFTLTNIPLTNTVSNTLTISDCTDIGYIYVGDTAVAPLENDSSWQSCSTILNAISFTVSSSEDAKNIYVWSKDVAGNISLTSTNSIGEMTLDSTPPILAWTTPPSSAVQQGAIEIVSWTLTELNADNTQSFQIEFFNGVNWIASTTEPVTSGPHSAQSFTSTFTYPSINLTTAKLRVTYSDLAGNSVTKETGAFIIDSVLPTVTSVNLNDGIASVALPTVNITVSGIDSHSGLSEVRVSENSVYSDDNWQPLSSALSLDISSTSGTKTVYAWLKDNAGNVSSSPLSDDIILDFGSAPNISLLTPDGSISYIENEVVNITWSCSHTYGLGTDPIDIEYTTNDGASFEPVSMSNTNSGSFNWSLPAALDGILFRLRLTCRSASGISTNTLSSYINTSNWNLYLGDPWYSLKNVTAAIANVGGFSGQSEGSVGVDFKNNYYYTKGHALMKINGQTGYVTQYAGSVTSSSNCDVSDGTDFLNQEFDSPIIFGNSSDFRFLFIYSKGCNKIYRLDTSTDIIEIWNSDPGFGTSIRNWFLNKAMQFFYVHGNENKVYLVDLSVKNSSKVPIHGDGTCGPSAPVGTAALNAPIKENANSICPGTILFFTNADGSKIWINGYHGVNGYRLDYNAGLGIYEIGSDDTGWEHSGHGVCKSAFFDNKVYCGPRTTNRRVRIFDLDTETWSAMLTVPFENNDDGGILVLGTTPTKILALYSLNEMKLLDPTNLNNETVIAGQPLSVMGNGTDLSKVAFHLPNAMVYNEATEVLWIRNQTGHFRYVDFKTSPPTIGTSYSNVLSSANASFSVNQTGDKIILPAGCGAKYVIKSLSISAFSLSNNPDLISTSGGCITAGIIAPIIDGASASDGSYMANNTTPHMKSQDVFEHTNGLVYFSNTSNNAATDDSRIYTTDGITFRLVAGQTGASGYSGDGVLATSAGLVNVRQIKEDSNGDLLIWDGQYRRKITVTTEAPFPKIYTEEDYSAASGIIPNGDWGDIHFDEATSTTYFTQDSGVYKCSAGVCSQYAFTGTTIEGLAKIEMIPEGLLVLQPNLSRILIIPNSEL